MKKHILKSGPAMAFELLSVDNKMIDFSEQINDVSELIPGITGKVDGKPCDGEFLLPDATKLIFVSGTLKKLIPADPVTAIAALKRQNSVLKARLHESAIFLTGLQKDINRFKDDIQSLLAPRKPFKKIGRKPSGTKAPFHLK